MRFVIVLAILHLIGELLLVKLALVRGDVLGFTFLLFKRHLVYLLHIVLLPLAILLILLLVLQGGYLLRTQVLLVVAESWEEVVHHH